MALSTADELVQLYIDTIIDQSDDQVPYKILSIWVEVFSELKAVADQIKALNDINNVTGKSLELLGKKWRVSRLGQTDEQLRDSIIDKMYLYFSGSTIPDLHNALIAFDAPAGSYIRERVPPEDAEINVFLNGAHPDLVARITAILRTIKAGGVELDVTNANTGDKLLAENDDFIVYEDGDFILLES
jgi:hypothetical protein